MNRFILISLLLFITFNSYSRNLRVALVGDPQVDDFTELGYARNSIFKELRERKDLDMVIFLGDLVNDDASLLLPVKSLLDSLPYPWYSVPGNHDRNRYTENSKIRDLKTWKSIIGPEDTTFVKNDVRFILMNNVRHSQRGDYEGGFRERQKHYLDSVLKHTDSEQKVLLAAHIPFAAMAGKDSLSAILASHPSILLVSGHTHNVRRHTLQFADASYDEIITGAACGTWWRGVKNDIGIPYALQNCGAPRGYFIADISNKRIMLEYKAVQRTDIASAFIVGDADEGKRKLYVNVYGGSKNGKVEVKVAGKRKEVAVQSSVSSPEVLSVIQYNKGLTREERRLRRDEVIPMRRLPSPHLWEIEISDDAIFPESIRVIYQDPMMKFRKKLSVQTM